MNIDKIEEVLVAFRDRRMADGLECTGLVIALPSGQVRRIGECYESGAKEAQKVVLDKASKTLTLHYCYESTDIRPRLSVLDCDAIVHIDVHCARKADVTVKGEVEIK